MSSTNNLSIADILKLAECLKTESTPCAGAPTQATTPADWDTRHPYVGKFVIVRCSGAGVHAGELAAVRGDEVRLLGSRRLWAFTVKSGIALSGAAQHGIKSSSKLDAVMPDIVVKGFCELLPCSDNAKASILTV